MRRRDQGPGNREQEGRRRACRAAGRRSCAAGLLACRAKAFPCAENGQAIRANGAWIAAGRETRRARTLRRARPCAGVALLEVVLALALFFGVAVVILGGLNTCMRAVRQVRLEATAADLAVTLLSEIELGVVPATDSGPKVYEEPLQDWTWEVVEMPVEGSLATMEVSRVEIIIRNTVEGYSHRLYHLLPAVAAGGDSTTASAAALAEAGGTP